MTLQPDERVLLRSGPSMNLLMAGVVGGFLFMTVISVPFIVLGAVDAGRRATFTAAALSMLAVVGIYLVIRNRDYAVTSDRVATASGFRDTEVSSVDVEDIDEVELVQAWWHRFLRVGTLAFVTENDDELRFGLVDSPHFVYERALDFTEGRTPVSDIQADRGSPM
jgi:uncharacterized membrane protein YdbT with pleckstrin-like domain